MHSKHSEKSAPGSAKSKQAPKSDTKTKTSVKATNTSLSDNRSAKKK